jgi:hypothetical protein
LSFEGCQILSAFTGALFEPAAAGRSPPETVIKGIVIKGFPLKPLIARPSIKTLGRLGVGAFDELFEVAPIVGTLASMRAFCVNAWRLGHHSVDRQIGPQNTSRTGRTGCNCRTMLNLPTSAADIGNPVDYRAGFTR